MSVPIRTYPSGALACAVLVLGGGGLTAQQAGKEPPSAVEKLRAEFEQRLEALKRRIAELEGKQAGAGKGDELAELRRAAAAAAAGSKPPPPEQQPTLLSTLNKFNPRVTLFGDFTATAVDGSLRNAAGDNVGDRFSARETELDMRADIDPFARGVFIFSLEEDSPGSFSIEPEEVYVAFDALPFGLRAKAGRFHTAFGSNNLLHTHDLPATDRPLAVTEFLGPDSDIEAGASADWLVPGLDAPSVTLTYQILNGENDRVLSGAESDHLAHLGHVRAFFDLPPASYLELGGSVLVGRAERGRGTQTVLAGADLLYKWRPEHRPNLRSVVVQAEAFHLSRRLANETIDSNGAYLQAQYQHRNWYLGLRGDWTQFAGLDRGDAWSGSGWLSYYTSEFLRMRVGAERLEDPRQDADWVFFLQLTFVVGAHPPHPYWVNK